MIHDGLEKRGAVLVCDVRWNRLFGEEPNVLAE
jgi:hypothetical protein